jgi:hypothetical protein
VPVSLLGRADEVLERGDYVCFWPKADIITVLSHVRFRG